MDKSRIKSFFYEIIRVILPPISYSLIQTGVILLARLLWIRQAYSLPGTDFGGFGSADAFASHMIYANYLSYALAAAVFAIILMTVVKEKDEEKRPWRLLSEESRGKYLLIVPLLGGASIAGNMILNRLGVTDASESFQEVQALLSGGSDYMILLSVGIVVPVCEEIVFRGLVYMRLREAVKPGWAVLISAVIFAVAHGNLPQGIFAFFLGLLLAFVYERYGSIAAPCLGHICANILSTAGSAMSDDPMPGFAVSAAAAVAVTLTALLIIRKMVPGGVIYGGGAPEDAEA